MLCDVSAFLCVRCNFLSAPNYTPQTHTDIFFILDAYHATVRADLDVDAQDLEAESWSLAVEQQHIEKHAKEMVKRQDVIYGECWQNSSVRQIMK